MRSANEVFDWINALPPGALIAVDGDGAGLTAWSADRASRIDSFDLNPGVPVAAGHQKRKSAGGKDWITVRDWIIVRDWVRDWINALPPGALGLRMFEPEAELKYMPGDRVRLSLARCIFHLDRGGEYLTLRGEGVGTILSLKERGDGVPWRPALYYIVELEEPQKWKGFQIAILPDNLPSRRSRGLVRAEEPHLHG